MYQLDLCREDPQGLEQVEWRGRAFVLRDEHGWSAWIPFRLGFIVGQYWTADDWCEAVDAVEEFNEQLDNQAKGSK